VTITSEDVLEPFPLPPPIPIPAHAVSEILLYRTTMSDALTLNEYQAGAAATAVYPDEARYVYPLLGLCGEAGEVAEKVVKGLFPAGPPKGWDDGSCVIRDVCRAVEEFVKAAARCEQLKKVVRDKQGTLPAGVLADFDARTAGFAGDPVEVKKELSDVAWYLADLSRRFGFALSDVAATNLSKLKARQEQGVLGGSGDNR